MNRPSKKEIKEALNKLHDAKQGSTQPEYVEKHLDGKKQQNKNRIRQNKV